MTDITKCMGKGLGIDCPLKEKCYRYTATAHPRRQSFLLEVSYDAEKEKCEHYWGNDDRLNHFKSIKSSPIPTGLEKHRCQKETDYRSVSGLTPGGF